MNAEAKKPFWVICSACGHCWAAAYLPMAARTFAAIVNSSAKMCQKCGAGKPLVAKQNDGVLLEPVQ